MAVESGSITRWRPSSTAPSSSTVGQTNYYVSQKTIENAIVQANTLEKKSNFIETPIVQTNKLEESATDDPL